MLVAISSAPAGDLELTREKGRARFDLTLPANWKAFASYTRERREGSRPFGAVFGGGGGGGNVEIPESIDYNTQDVMGGLQFANALTSVNLQAAASFFENDIDTMLFQNPLFITTNTIAGVPATTFTQGQFDLYPSNEYYNVKGEFARKLPKLLKSRVTGVVSLARSQQNDNLIPSAIEPLTGGTINGVPTVNVWNTTASLSRLSADARIDTTLVDVGIILNPARALAVKGKVRYFDTDNSTEYLACNPLTGQWGRLLNNGSGGSFVTPNLTVGNNPVGTLNTGYNGARCDYAATQALGLAPSLGDVPIRSVPYEYRQLNSVVSADYRLNRTNSLEAAYERENFRREHREREKTWEDKIRLGYVNRDTGTGTLRLSYRVRPSSRQRLPGDQPGRVLQHFARPGAGRCHDEHRLVAAQRRAVPEIRRRRPEPERLQCPVQLRHRPGAGRERRPAGERRGVSSVGVWTQRSSQADVPVGGAQLAAVPGHERVRVLLVSAGLTTSSRHPAECLRDRKLLLLLERRLGSDERDRGAPARSDGRRDPAGAGGELAIALRDGVGGQSALSNQPDLGRVSRGSQPCRRPGLSLRDGQSPDGPRIHLFEGPYKIGYGYNPAALGLNATQVTLAGDGWEDLVFVQNLVEANALVPLLRRLSLRLLYRFEDARIRDWHYNGVSVNPMPANNGAYLDFGPRDYKVHLFGALFRYEL